MKSFGCVVLVALVLSASAQSAPQQASSGSAADTPGSGAGNFGVAGFGNMPPRLLAVKPGVYQVTQRKSSAACASAQSRPLGAGCAMSGAWARQRDSGN